MILSKDLKKQEFDLKSTPIWQNYGGCGRLRTEESIRPGQALLTICQEVSFLGEQGRPAAAACGHAPRRPLLRAPALPAVPQRPCTCAAGRRPPSGRTAPSPARALIAGAQFVACSSWCFSCEPAFGLLGSKTRPEIVK